MWRRAKRWLSSPAAVAVVATLVLLVSACSVEAAGSATAPEWRPPLHTEEVAAASTTRVAAALQQRSQFSLPLVVLLEIAEHRVPPKAHLPLRCREGSLPPTRLRYRRAVHDDRSDLPA